MDEVGQEIREKRIQKEFSNIRSYSGLKTSHSSNDLGHSIIHINVNNRIIQDRPANLEENLLFDIVLDEKYPFSHPRIYCRSIFNGFDLNDGRDLFEPMYNQGWNPSSTVCDLITKFPVYINSLLQMLDISWDIGDFNAGDKFPSDFWTESEVLYSFKVQEMAPQKRRLILMISQLAVLQLVEQTQRNVLVLDSWASFDLLDDVSLADNKTIHLAWKGCEKSEAYEQTLVFENARKCYDVIKKHITIFNTKVSRAALSEEEVSKHSIQRINIENIFTEIERFEIALENGINSYIVKGLMENYSHAIEYLSAVDDPRYGELLAKVHTVLQNQEVVTLLQQIQDNEGNSDVETETAEQSPQINEDLREQLRKRGEDDPLNSQAQ